jgi:hypothetical protein
MSASKKRPKKKMTLKVSHKKPRDPVAKEVTKKRSGPMKDRRKEKDWKADEDNHYDGDSSTPSPVPSDVRQSDPGSE